MDIKHPFTLTWALEQFWLGNTWAMNVVFEYDTSRQELGIPSFLE